MKEYVTEFPDGALVRWRPLTWVEFKELQTQYKDVMTKGGAAEWLLLEAAASLCILGSVQHDEPLDGLDELYAGTLAIVGRSILEESGFFAVPELIEKKRNEARLKYTQDWYEEAKSYIMFLFRVTERQINNWDLDKFMEYVTRVETVIGKPLDIVNPNEESDEPHTMTTDDGRVIPLLTKKDLQKNTPINPEKDLREMRAEERKVPEKRVHPLRQRLNEIHEMKRRGR